MAYSTSPQTVEKIRHMLLPLEQGKACTWSVRPEDLASTTYKIREALYIARLRRTQFPALAEAAARFSITSRMPGTGETLATIMARPRKHHSASALLEMIDTYEPAPVEPLPVTLTEPAATAPAFEPPPADLPVPIPFELPVVEAPPEAPRTIKGLHNRFTVVSAWTEQHARVLHFPEASLSVEDLTAIYRWAQSQDPPLMILAEPGMAEFTLSYVDPDVEEFQWRPTDYTV